MRIILRNEDAQRLAELLDELPEEEPSMKIKGKRVEIHVGGEVFRGRPRRTPNTAGSLVVEDMDGHAVLVAESD
jgi:hypothetical protein